MDIEYMTAKLREFRDLCAGMANAPDMGPRPMKARVDQLEPVVRRILAALDPELAHFDMTDWRRGGYHAGVRAADGGLGLLAERDALERALGPQGPSLAAGDLHEWVWSAAATFWDADQFLVAVEQAAKSVNAHLQRKLDVHDLSDDALLTEAWSDKDPKPDRPRLRIPGDRASLTWKSQQSGAGFLARGCSQGIRNVAAHTVGLGDRQLALEFLAALSVLARWIDSAEVERVD